MSALKERDGVELRAIVKPPAKPVPTRRWARCAQCDDEGSQTAITVAETTVDWRCDTCGSEVRAWR